ncbi:M56 family metallopeptidase [Streptomyces sp. 549]|uniref:M56 family metallopeptidase n=1 Tax=Streptomyces sp. 549 TaxID=3049076 RepID=UPI0024C2E4B0|nr:M56 family metallopeptidase [Streptomyces sp. 549]MDK1473147.1 M56 family metallopeptidase [Streptomyces sp. 549]
MGVFVFLPLVLPLSAWPIARLAEQHLHPRAATWLLTVVAVVLAVCSTLCLALVMVVGTAQLPGNPLPDGWSHAEVREAVPFDEVAGKASIPALAAALACCAWTAWRHRRVRLRALQALADLSPKRVAVLPDDVPYAYALPGKPDRVVATTGMLHKLTSSERRALFAHERAHLACRHHRFVLAVQIAARANPFLRPLRTAVGYSIERWADEEAAARIGDRRLVARAVGRAALVSRGTPGTALAGFAAPGPVPRRVAALLGPTPSPRNWPPVFTAVGLAAWAAAAGTTASALSSANAAVSLFLILEEATPL